MRIEVLIFLLLFCSTQTCAKADTQIISEDGIEQVCRTVLTFSEIVIRGKQENISLSEMLKAKDKLIEKFGDEADLSAKIFQWMIDDAYKLPNFNNDEKKQQQLREFTEGQYFACKNSLNKERNENE